MPQNGLQTATEVLPNFLVHAEMRQRGVALRPMPMGTPMGMPMTPAGARTPGATPVGEGAHRRVHLHPKTKSSTGLSSLMAINQPHVRMQAEFAPPVTLPEVLADACLYLYPVSLSLQNVSLFQLQEDRQRDRLCLPLSSRGQYLGLPAPLYQASVGLYIYVFFFLFSILIAMKVPMDT